MLLLRRANVRAIALARRWAEQARADAARQLLLGVYQRFTEGFTTADLKMAAQLLDQFGQPAGSKSSI
jgi:predicted ATPase